MVQKNMKKYVYVSLTLVNRNITEQFNPQIPIYKITEFFTHRLNHWVKITDKWNKIFTSNRRVNQKYSNLFSCSKTWKKAFVKDLERQGSENIK